MMEALQNIGVEPTNGCLEIGSRLKALRLAAGLGVQALASRLNNPQARKDIGAGIDVTTVDAWEHGVLGSFHAWAYLGQIAQVLWGRGFRSWTSKKKSRVRLGRLVFGAIRPDIADSVWLALLADLSFGFSWRRIRLLKNDLQANDEAPKLTRREQAIFDQVVESGDLAREAFHVLGRKSKQPLWSEVPSSSIQGTAGELERVMYAVIYFELHGSPDGRFHSEGARWSAVGLQWLPWFRGVAGAFGEDVFNASLPGAYAVYKDGSSVRSKGSG